MLDEIKIVPGIYSDTTARTPENRWKDGNNIRFRNGLPEKIGGHTRVDLVKDSVAGFQFVGIARTTWDWTDLAGETWTAVGTTEKLYLVQGNVVYDITPLRLSSDTAGNLTNPFSTTNGSNVVVVAHTAHGLGVGDHVYFDAASTVGGLNMDGEWVVSTVDNSNQYRFLHTSNASSTVAGGGGSTSFDYEIGIGGESASAIYGYGAGGYGMGGYGIGVISMQAVLGPRVWSLDNWGEDLVASFNGGPIFHWDKTNGPTVRAQRIASAPQVNQRILVSQEDRHLIAFGGSPLGGTDPLLVRWCNQEDFDTWDADSTNTAGDKRLDQGSMIITAVRSREEIVIWTDISMYSMKFIGEEDVFGFQPLAGSVAIVGPNAMAESNGVIYFMGVEDFLVYDGNLRVLPCPVHDMVFDRFNSAQGYKVVACINQLFAEVWWFLPINSESENNFCVIYNYGTGHWYYRDLSRSAFHDQSLTYRLPYGITQDGSFYLHEVGKNDDGASMPYYIESWDAEINGGDQMMRINEMVPDFQTLVGDATLIMKSRQYPGSMQQQIKGPYPITSTTEKISVRTRGRQTALRIAGEGVDCDFRMNTWRARYSVDAKR